MSRERVTDLAHFVLKKISELKYGCTAEECSECQDKNIFHCGLTTASFSFHSKSLTEHRLTANTQDK
jgi:hypothetical protein